MSTLKATNIKNESSASNNIVLDSGGGVVVSGIITATTFSGNVSGNITIGAGSTSAPSLSPSGDSNTGVFFPAADTIAFAEGGTEVARFDSSGRLLVGTSSARTGLYAGVSPVQINDNGSARNLDLIGTANSPYGPEMLFIKARSGTSIVQNGDILGEIKFIGYDGATDRLAGKIAFEVDGTPGTSDMPGRLIFATTADGAGSPTERMRITNAGVILGGNTSVNGSHPKAHLFRSTETTDGAGVFIVENSNATNGTSIFVGVGAAGVAYNASNCVLGVYRCSSNSRSINAAGTINASGADYAEYMTKGGDFTIAKGDICGVDARGKLTNIFSNSVGFLVKSTDPSYVGGDTWGLGFEDDQEGLENARKQVDRIAFAGQVPVNVINAMPGQYIVPVEDVDGGIAGIAKNETALTLAEYMRAVGKVIAIEDDGRARIIVKVA